MISLLKYQAGASGHLPLLRYRTLSTINREIVIMGLPQSKNIELPDLIPGKVVQAVIYPTIVSGKESKVPAKLELKSTCGCPVNEATLRQTEQTGAPTEIDLKQVLSLLTLVCGCCNTKLIDESSRAEKST